MPNESDRLIGVSLKEYFEERFKLLDESFTNKLQALDKAREKAEEQMNQRLKGMNEFRAALADQSGRMLSRNEYELGHRALDEKVRGVEGSLLKSPTRAEIETSQKVNEEKVRSLELAKANQDGRSFMISTLTSAATSIIVGVVIFLVSRYAFKP
jgi:hypothetical protein